MTERRLKELPLRPWYSTNRNDLIAEFYEPCLSVSSVYDRAVGYFRSSVLLLAERPVADFAVRGGKIRLICSPELTPEDIEALEEGYQWREQVGDAISRSIEDALASELGKPSVQFLATLVAIGCLDVRVAFRPGARGLFHDKVGVFRDEVGQMVSFTGSSNETFNAWDVTGNHEVFDVFCSWTADNERVNRHLQYFESLWSGHEPGLEVVDFPDVARERLKQVADPEGVEAAYEKVAQSRSRSRPRSGKIPQPHQREAIDAWKRNERRGILEHATGSGKTITAMIAMREWLEMGRPVMVLVPSQLLLEQWRKEVKAELRDVNPKMLLAGGGNSLWRRDDVLEGYTQADGGPRVTISTLQTAASGEFHSRVQSGEHLLLVIDEVHRAGSPHLSQVFSVDAGARLGLSATPHRYGDPTGTELLLNYFGGIVDSPFTLADAIRAKRLTRYNYHVHPVELSHDEIEEWRLLTERIKREVARGRHSDTGEAKLTEKAKMLLIQRARILKDAEAKVPLAVEVLQQNYQKGQRWLIYCDNQNQLREVLNALRSRELPAYEYHAAMQGAQEATLEYFTTLGGILVAIKMLDEGVDIPTIDHALILASSRNPREFIQRRGRVLRMAEDKFFAEIHDALVIPPSDDHRSEDKAILRTEIGRALQFAESAANDSVGFQLRRIAREADLDLDVQTSEDDFEEDSDQ